MFVIKNKIKRGKSIIALLFISLICSSFSYADDNNVVIKSFAKTNDDTGVIIRDDGNKNYTVVYFPEDKEALDVTFSGIKFGTATEETIEASKNYCTPSFSSCQANLSLNSVYDSISVKTKTKMGLEKETVKEKMLEFKPFISKNVLMLKNIQDDEIIISEILSENNSITTPDRSFPIVLKKDEFFEIKLEAKDGDKAENYAIKVKYTAHGNSLTGKIIIAKQYDEILSKCLANS